MFEIHEMKNIHTLRRFAHRNVRLTFWQSLKGLLQRQGWKTERREFVEVKPDDPGYDNAIFEEKIIFGPRNPIDEMTLSGPRKSIGEKA